jgi:hypothetical protein
MTNLTSLDIGSSNWHLPSDWSGAWYCHHFDINTNHQAMTQLRMLTITEVDETEQLKLPPSLKAANIFSRCYPGT